MIELVQNPTFTAFIDLIRQQRESVIIDACMESTVASQRASMAAIGELRCYNVIISTFEDHLSRAQDERDREAPSA
jgi:hypothetical protein